MTDSAYLGIGLGAFVAALLLEFGLYYRVLRTPLKAGDLQQARPAIVRWLKLDLVLQGAIVVASLAYVLVLSSRQAHGMAWIAPPVGAVFGSALPLQVVLSAMLRAARP